MSREKIPNKKLNNFEEKLQKLLAVNTQDLPENELAELREQITELSAEIAQEQKNKKQTPSKGINIQGGSGHIVMDGVTAGSNISINYQNDTNYQNGLQALQEKIAEASEAFANKTGKQILFITSSPEGKNPLDFGKELKKINKSLITSKSRDDYFINV